jgi:hypothetical protein
LESSLGDADGDEDDTELPHSPEISILPIPRDDPTSASPISESTFPVVGRGKVEVEEALERAESVLAGKHEEVAIDDDQLATPSSVSPLHAEL